MSAHGVVAGTSGDDSATSGAVEFDAVERTVSLEVAWFVDEAILAAEICVDDAQVVPDSFAGLIEEDGAPALVREFGERFLSRGEDRFGLDAEDVDCGVGLLADVDVVLDAGVAGIVDAVGEEKDEVTGEWVRSPELVTASFVDGIEDNCAAQTACMVDGNIAKTHCEGVVVGGPALHDLRLGVEAHDECAVSLFVEELSDVFIRYRLVATEVFEHRSAGVHEDAKTDREVLMCFKGDDLARGFPVVEDTQIVEFEIVDWNAVKVGGVEGEAYLVDGYVEDVWIVSSRRSFGRLRESG